MSTQANPVNWFEIPVNDMERAKAFYEFVFEIEMSSMQMGPALMNFFPWQEGAPGATGTLIKTEGYIPSHEGSIVYFSVESIENTSARIQEKGGKILVPKMPIGEHGFIAHFEDSEGNRVALHSMN